VPEAANSRRRQSFSNPFALSLSEAKLNHRFNGCLSLRVSHRAAEAKQSFDKLRTNGSGEGHKPPTLISLKAPIDRLVYGV
jgi:hypothetical protein